MLLLDEDPRTIAALDPAFRDPYVQQADLNLDSEAGLLSDEERAAFTLRRGRWFEEYRQALAGRSSRSAPSGRPSPPPAPPTRG